MGKEARVAKKVQRFVDGGKLRTLDLFAGCGGFSLGFHRAGYSIVGAIEVDPHAVSSHALNFGLSSSDGFTNYSERPIDITEVEPLAFLRASGWRGPEKEAIDVLIGGPPCQAFARIGRAKLRQIAKDPKAHQTDKRASLVAEYIRFVDSLRPLVLVVENVPDMMNQKGVNVVANVCESLTNLGYVCRYTLLNAANYGVPQYRERVFIIGFHESLGLVPSFPSPTHTLDLPSGYLFNRHVAMKPISDSGRDCDWFVETGQRRTNLKVAVTCDEALSDLPKIVCHLRGKMPAGVRQVDVPVQYRVRGEPSGYAMAMRGWPGFATEGFVTGHVIRSLPRDYETFRRMRTGAQYPEAHEVAIQIYNEEIEKLNGHAPKPGSPVLADLWSRIVPPYDPNKFPNKWWKLDPKRPSRTLTAHIGKDTYSHIHYDSCQARTISVREAARLQSFPDGFQFSGAMNAAFKQIGNAVPPLLSCVVARKILKQLKQSLQLGSKQA